MRRPLLASVLLLLLAAGLVWIWLARPREGERDASPEAVPAAGPGAFDLGDVVAGFRLETPRTAPTGPTLELPRARAAGTRSRTRGTFRYVQTASGTFGPEKPRPRRAVWGAVDATTLVEPGKPFETRVAVDGELQLTDVLGEAAPRARSERFTLSFDVASNGAADPRSTLFRAPDDLRDLLGTLVARWTEAPPLPDRPLRVGDAFEPTAAIDVDPWRRTMWEVFQRGNPERPPVVEPVEGRAWVAATESHEGEDVLVVRTAFNHAHVADTGPLGRDAVQIAYAAAERSTRRLAVADGLSRTHDLSLRRRLRARGKGFDTTVDTLEQVVLSTTRGP